MAGGPADKRIHHYPRWAGSRRLDQPLLQPAMQESGFIHRKPVYRTEQAGEGKLDLNHRLRFTSDAPGLQRWLFARQLPDELEQVAIVFDENVLVLMLTHGGQQLS